MAVKREGLEGETAFFIRTKSKQVVRHLNSFFSSEMPTIQQKIEFSFPVLSSEDFSLGCP